MIEYVICDIAPFYTFNQDFIFVSFGPVYKNQVLFEEAPLLNGNEGG